MLRFARPKALRFFLRAQGWVLVIVLVVEGCFQNTPSYKFSSSV